jgi:excisionase family DNA binding protein
MNEEWISPKDFAARLGISDETVYIWIRQGKLAAVRLGAKCLRLSAAECDRFIAERMTGSPAAQCDRFIAMTTTGAK